MVGQNVAGRDTPAHVELTSLAMQNAQRKLDEAYEGAEISAEPPTQVDYRPHAKHIGPDLGNLHCRLCCFRTPG